MGDDTLKTTETLYNFDLARPRFILEGKTFTSNLFNQVKWALHRATSILDVFFKENFKVAALIYILIYLYLQYIFIWIFITRESIKLRCIRSLSHCSDLKKKIVRKIVFYLIIFFNLIVFTWSCSTWSSSTSSSAFWSSSNW